MKISDFNLNKQSLKRKLNEFNDIDIKQKVENILNERTTEFSLETIEFIINAFYSDEYLYARKTSNQPLSVFYKTKNKEKYKKLKILIDIKNDIDPNIILEKEIKSLNKESQNFYMDFDNYIIKLNQIADKFNILPTEVYKINNKLETDWLNKIIEL